MTDYVLEYTAQRVDVLEARCRVLAEQLVDATLRIGELSECAMHYMAREDELVRGIEEQAKEAHGKDHGEIGYHVCGHIVCQQAQARRDENRERR